MLGKGEIAQEVAQRTGLPRSQATKAVDAMIDVMQSAIARGDGNGLFQQPARAVGRPSAPPPGGWSVGRSPSTAGRSPSESTHAGSPSIFGRPS